MKKGILLLPLIPFAFGQDYQVHILKPGDTLSKVLLEQGFTPLWGRNNWVEKTLSMNHMKLEDASKIKKGLPIILPAKPQTIAELDLKELEKDFVSMKESSYVRAGLLGNTISDHQKVFIELDYYTSAIDLSSDTVTLNENYGLGFRVDGENDYILGAMTYNFNGSAYLYTHGSAQFDKIKGTTASFDPTYVLHTEMEIKAPEVNFNFGPTLMLEERSRLIEKNSLLSQRRDRTSWLGFQMNKIIEVDHLRYEFTAGARRKLFNQNIVDRGNFNASNVYLNTKVNLTRDYDFALKFSQTQYQNLGIERENTIGANFSYNVQ